MIRIVLLAPFEELKEQAEEDGNRTRGEWAGI